MIYTASPIAVVIFFSFVATVLGISFYFAKKTRTQKVTLQPAEQYTGR